MWYGNSHATHRASTTSIDCSEEDGVDPTVPFPAAFGPQLGGRDTHTQAVRAGVSIAKSTSRLILDYAIDSEGGVGHAKNRHRYQLMVRRPQYSDARAVPG